MTQENGNLDQRIDAAKKKFDKEHNPAPTTNDSLSDGARAGIELVGAMLGGALMGWLLDKAFDTSPALFITFFIFGVITGFYNIYKIANNITPGTLQKPLHPVKKDAIESPNDNTDVQN